MSLSTFDIPSGGYREVRPCSAQLVETYGPDGKCWHQEVIIHLLPQSAQHMTMAAFFNPLQSHGRGIMTKMSYPPKCSSVITSIYVDGDNPRTFRCGIRAFYQPESIMKSQEAVDQIQVIIDDLEVAKQEIEDNDMSEFDIGRELTSITSEVDRLTDYLDDQT